MFILRWTEDPDRHAAVTRLVGGRYRGGGGGPAEPERVRVCRMDPRP